MASHTKDNAHLLENISVIKKVKRIQLTKKIRDKIGEERFLKIARSNSRKLNVYRIEYLSQGHVVVGHIVEPKKGDNLPCIVWNRGGSGDFSAITLGALFVCNIEKLANAGYIVIASQYSGNVGSEGKDEEGGGDLHDILNLYKIIKEYTRADEKRIGMYGASRGGMMTYMALKEVRWIKAAATVAGLANLTRNAEERPGMREIFEKAFGATKKGMKDRSALCWPEKLPKKAPLLLQHGTADWRVNPLDSMELAESLYKQKVPYRLIVYGGGDHGLTEFREKVDQETIEWFDRFVKNGETLPNLKPHGD
jgi:dipeptidyl aminopeptidase/acylaminoacyl peptidase